MKQYKIIIGMMFVTVIGIAMPVTFSAGAGQHRFIQMGSAGGGQTPSDEFCIRCHNDYIQSELASSDKGLYFSYGEHGTIHETLSCVGCHRITSGYGQDWESEQHAARIPSCIECHTRGSSMTVGNAGNEMKSPTEAHKGFVGQKDDIACIGCHTDVTIQGSVSYTYSTGEIVSGLSIGKVD